MIIHIDGQKILTQTLTTVIFQPEDKEILTLLENLRNRKGEKKGAQLGIAFNSDVVLFSLQKEQHEIKGFLFNLNSSHRFRNNLGEILGKNQALWSFDNVGLVISESVNYDIPPLSKIELIKLCSDLLEHSDHLSPENLKYTNSATKIKVMSSGGIRKDASNIVNADLDLSIHDQNIEIAGNIEINEASENHQRKFTTLRPDAFHFSSQLISVEINDSIKSFFGDTIPDLISLSVNFFGSEFIDEPSFFIVPNMDLVLEFKDNFQLIELLKANPEIKEVNADNFTYGTIKFYYKQMNEKSVYLGRNKFDQGALTQISEISIVSGKLDALLKIEGEGMMVKLIKITTLYNLSKDVADRIDFFELIIDEPSGNKANVRGSIRFKEEYYAINEILKFGLKGQFLK